MQSHCYEFQSDLVNGAGTAGGLLAITVTILYGQLSAQAWLEKKRSKSRRKRKKRCLKLLSYLLGVVPLVFIALLTTLGVIKIALLNSESVFTALPNYLNVIFYLSPL